MNIQQLARYRVISLIAVSLWLLTISVSAQNDPAPEFLYRDGNRLVLLNGYTGEKTELPLEVTRYDQIEWSPDGRYLVTRLDEDPSDTNFIFCLNLYDVDRREWFSSEPISCAVQGVAFFSDSKRLLYTTTDQINATLWLYSLESGSRQELYRTTDGNELMPSGISDLRLSPKERYLSFVDYTEIMGGTINEFVVMNTAEQDYVTISAPDTYYAHYTPIWSPNDDWFLIVMQEDYVTSGALASTNHQGDLYLVNPETGEMFRITYTPAGFETDIRWTEDGEIAFRTVTMIEDNFSFTTEEAMSIETIPDSEIVQPEPITAEDFSLRRGGVPGMVSPDPNLTAWIGSFNQISAEGGFVELKIGFWIDQAPIINVTISIPATSTYERVIIGWRPTDYPYPEG
jgi:Tol biopolymer transport system component